MAQIIGLPKLSPTMEEGVLIRWVKKEGDPVEPGDLIAEIETDKANMDFTLEDEGVLLKFLVPEGSTVKLGAPVLILGEEGEETVEIVADAMSQISATADSPITQTAAATPETIAAEPSVVPKPSSPADIAATGTNLGGRILASPLARTLSGELGIDLRTIKGSGPGGRIVERDLRDLKQTQTAPTLDSARPTETGNPQPAPAGGSSVDSEYEEIPLTNIRRTIAERLTTAARDIPHFRLVTSFEATALLHFRKRLNELVSGHGKISINDFLIKGVALALGRVPEVNVTFMGTSIRQFRHVHMGVAVALERGLITPVVRNAESKGLGAISREVKDLVSRAKERKLKAHEIQGSTFTISNLGMFGIDQFDGIINSPEGAILAVGRIVKQPVIDADGQIAVGQRMNLTMSCDHRVIDGAVGARFLDELVTLLENPESLAL